ncbi:hypothetical protein C8R45DRAFT_989790 [Mycena sanguinolenta]|nr:hypothetical protein C8R45DRAFT_989790 [Mycena sanguinolenta]
MIIQVHVDLSRRKCPRGAVHTNSTGVGPGLRTYGIKVTLLHSSRWNAMTGSESSRDCAAPSRGKPTSYLHKACNNCRRRKIRCDGERPICSRCRVQPPRSLVPCAYSHLPVGATPPELQELLETMQNRFHELEHQVEVLSGKDLSTVFLSEPYSNQPVQPQLAGDGSFPHLSMVDAGSDLSDILPAPPNTPEELPELTGAPLDVFPHHFSRHHFFLEATQFQKSASIPTLLPRGLLDAMVLWANRISANSVAVADSGYSDEELLARAVHHVARDIAVVEPLPRQMLHLIQSEVLLALYYLNCGRLLEGNYHRAGAVSLAFSMGLHRLGPSSQGGYPLGKGSLAQMFSPVQISDVSRMEMIDAFWSVMILNNCFVAASDIPSSIPCDAPVSTPWPTHFLNIATLAPFTPGNDLAGHSPLTLLAKASIQLERTVAFIARNAAFPPPPEFWAIGTRLETFRDHLPPFDANHPTDQVSLVTHSFVNVAIIRLHSPHTAVHADARPKCLAAAYCVAARLADAPIAEWEMADPILGPLLAAVADVLIANLNHDASASMAMQTTLSAMQVLAPRTPLIQQHLAATRLHYESAQRNLDSGPLSLSIISTYSNQVS